jgi:PTS system nitrogen regulatory IIA component
MKICKTITEDLIRVDLPGETKREVLEALVDLAARGGGISDRHAALEALLEREARMSTGIQNGIAIPHGKSTAVKELVACLGVARLGIDFDSLDGLPCRIFVMTLSPVDRVGPHIQFLAGISRILKDPLKRDGILRAETPAEVLKILQG